MTAHRRAALAQGVLLAAGLVVALATVWYFAGTGHQVTSASAAPKATEAGARTAADALVGAVKAADPDGVCTLLSNDLRAQHADCSQWARTFIGATTDARYLVLAVVMQPRARARVRMLIDGDHYFWFFHHQRDGWRFESAAPVPRQ